MSGLSARLLVPIRNRNKRIPGQARNDVLGKNVPSPNVILMAVGTAGRAAAFVAGGRAVRVLLAPKFHFLLLGALYAPLAHFLIVLNLCFRKFSVLPEYDVEA